MYKNILIPKKSIKKNKKKKKNTTMVYGLYVVCTYGVLESSIDFCSFITMKPLL